MNSFARLLSLLRKEHKMSQKELAAALGISQALLSHYEKGIRECGLDFVVKTADYFGVSCDYLLGRTPHRSGMTLTEADVPEPDAAEASARRSGDSRTQLTRKLIGNSLHVLFGTLNKIGSENLTQEVTLCLDIVVYRLFRLLFCANPKNLSAMFSVSETLFPALSTAAYYRREAQVKRLLTEKTDAQPKPSVPILTEETISAEYPLYASSLLDLIQTVETRLEN